MEINYQALYEIDNIKRAQEEQPLYNGIEICNYCKVIIQLNLCTVYGAFFL